LKINLLIFKLGFIGFGEAGFEMSRGLKSEGLQEILAYDKCWNVQPDSELIKDRIRHSGIHLLSTIEDLVTQANVVISVTSSRVALEVASEVVPYLNKKKVFVDANAASPKLKKKISSVVRESGAKFVDVAMMGALPLHQHKVPIFASGDGVDLFFKMMTPYGMRITVVGEEPGRASAIKMFRSVYMKGCALLLLESLFAAYKYGVEDYVLESLTETMDNTPFVKTVSRLVNGTAVHANRRIHEMADVLQTLQELEITPVMSEATKKGLEWIANLKLKEHFGGKVPTDYKNVLKEIQTKVKENK